MATNSTSTIVSAVYNVTPEMKEQTLLDRVGLFKQIAKNTGVDGILDDAGEKDKTPNE